MPDVNDYRDDEEQGSATGMPHQAKVDPGQQQEYVPWSSFEAANRDVSQREAGKLRGKVQGDVSKASDELANAQHGFDAGLEGNYGSSSSSSSSSSPSRGANGEIVAAHLPPEAPKSGNGEFGAAHLPAPEAAVQVPKQFADSQQAQSTAGTSNPWASFSAGVAGENIGKISQLDGSAANPMQAPSGGAPEQIDPGSSGGTPSRETSPGVATLSQADEGNPWASFLAPAAQSGGPAAAAQPGGPADGKDRALQGKPLHDALRPYGLNADAAAGKATGAHDLEGAAGADAWKTLLGDTLGASNEARALGSEKGVQALLQKGQTSPVGDTAFDAALINGQGQKDFMQLSQQYGGGQLMKNVVDAEKASQDRWKTLQGDIAARQAQDKPGAASAATPAPPISTEPGQTPAAQDADLHSLLYGEGGTDFFSLMHQAGLSFSPADWAAIGLGEAGNDTPMPTEAYVNATVGSIANGTGIKASWPQGKFEMAWGLLSHEYNGRAMHALLQYLSQNKAEMKRFLGMQNPGYMARNLRMWLSQNGYQKGEGMIGTSNSEVQVAGQTRGETDTPYGATTDAQETARTNAYRTGWGEEWDRQFRGGNKTPKQP